METLVVDNVPLEPGKFYVVKGDEYGFPKRGFKEFNPAMYVREEFISFTNKNWYVFAALDIDNSILMRVRIQVSDRSIKGGVVIASGLESFLILSDKGDGIRKESVSSFIDKAYEKIEDIDLQDFDLGRAELIHAIRSCYGKDHNDD